MAERSLIPACVAESIPAEVAAEINKLGPLYQEEFVREYRKNARSTCMAYLMWSLGLLYYYFGDRRKLILFWVLLLPSLIWAAIDGFRIPQMVRQHNHQLARDLLRYMRTMAG